MAYGGYGVKDFWNAFSNCLSGKGLSSVESSRYVELVRGFAKSQKGELLARKPEDVHRYLDRLALRERCAGMS